MLRIARQLNDAAGAIITTHHIDSSVPFPSPEMANSFDLAITTDALHDISDPVVSLRAVWSLLKPDGIYLLCEPNPALSKHWSAPMHFGVSLAACLPSGTCSPPYAGIGQLGLTESVLTNLAGKTGFIVRSQPHATTDMFHSFYILSKMPMACL